jgi:hypothetical protein
MHDSPVHTPSRENSTPPPYRKSAIPVRRRKDHVHDWLSGGSRESSVDRIDRHLRSFQSRQKRDEPLPEIDEAAPEQDEYSHSPATPWGVINFALDTAEILS